MLQRLAGGERSGRAPARLRHDHLSPTTHSHRNKMPSLSAERALTYTAHYCATQRDARKLLMLSFSISPPVVRSSIAGSRTPHHRLYRGGLILRNDPQELGLQASHAEAPALFLLKASRAADIYQERLHGRDIARRKALTRNPSLTLFFFNSIQ